VALDEMNALIPTNAHILESAMRVSTGFIALHAVV